MSDYAKYTVDVTSQVEFCTATINPETGQAQEMCDIIVKANDGYDFSEAATPIVRVSYEDSYYNSVYRDFPLNKVSDTEYSLLEWIFANEKIPDTNKYYVDEIDPDNDVCEYSIIAVASAKTEIDVTYGTSQLYLLSSDNIKTLASSRLVTNADKSTTDLGEFIISLMKLYISIPDDKLITENLKLFTYTSNISCKAIKTLNQKIDCGIVNVPLLLNTECKLLLYLPFYGIEDVSGYKNELSEKPLSLIYNINIANGETLIKVKCMDLDLYYSCNLGYNIPFFMNTYNNPTLNKSLTIDNYFLSDDFTPYLYIIPDKSTDLEIEGITEDERELLKSALRNGYLKDGVNHE